VERKKEVLALNEKPRQFKNLVVDFLAFMSKEFPQDKIPLTKEEAEALPKTWEEIIAVEPRLLALYDEALQACRENRGRRRQSGVMIFYRQFKPRVVALVGFGAVGERLYHPQYFGKRTPYDIAYEKILGAVCGSGRKRTRR
jgi:hypothetical protein